MAVRPVEQPTLLERFVLIIPLRYRYAALVWALILPSSPVYYLVSGAFTLFLSNFLNGILNFLLPLYLFLVVRYVRLKTLGAEAQIAPRLEGGVEDYHRAFGRMTQTRPVIVLSTTFAVLILASYAAGGILASALSLLIPTIIVVYVSAFGFATYIWEFASVSIGIHRLGGSSLRLGSFLEDRMMGTRPLGNLALSLILVYFGGLAIILLLFSTFVTTTLESQWPWFGFLFLGIIFFFLPLNSVHARMQQEKRRLLREIGVRYPSLSSGSTSVKGNATMDDLRAELNRLTDLQEVEMLDKKIAALPTWPFDVQVVSKFITIVLSVTAVLLSRIITGFLHI